MTEKEMREFLKVVEESSEKALEEIKKEQVGSGQMSEFGYFINYLFKEEYYEQRKE